ncbi:Zinc finger A20 and AN1 domain-containing stress-associated protein 2 [Capsicum baccatum]|uniref:Zinc finger A20 and AN1 domain-containing stress-associated protein 2 n=1 Tax=Capsicum baccatum TaxID=33114 RepID=A0A2G2V9G2_CAPBA|nr:Zinc finger A20 and AN1 domain-containing stress-associated protein 2 [Capsicum baccatum]
MESSKETGCRAAEDPVLCINDYDFLGSAATMNMCSKCQKDMILLKQEHAKLAAASNKDIVCRSSSSDESELALAGAAVASGDLASQISQEQARLAALAAAQVHQQNIDNPGRETNPDNEDLAFDDDDDDLDGAGATGDIIPPPLALGAKFNITSTMIQLIQLKGLFGGLAGDDPNMHLINFISTCKSFDKRGIGQNAIRLHLFPLSLSGEATLWLNGLTPDSITNWRQLRDAFLEDSFRHPKEHN